MNSSSTASPTPAALGFRWPAEWERHAATWLAWPRNPATWPGRFERVPAPFAELVRGIARFEPARVLCGGEFPAEGGGGSVRGAAEDFLGNVPNVELVEIPTNDSWCRDHGPMFLLGPAGDTLMVDWGYNAWGGKYPPFDLDAAVPRRLAERLGLPRVAGPILLEGGAVEGNGEGDILTTATCLLHENRNRGITVERAEQALREFAGARKVHWLPRGELAGDDTDGHIDQLARFVGPHRVVAAVAAERGDVNHDPLAENLAALRRMTLADGSRLEVIPLPLPPPLYVEDQRLPASYCNFCLVNGAVLVPAFDDPADARAAAILHDCFPERELLLLPSRELVWGLGSFHCLTQQQPAP